jgi:hypothetical protein
MAKEQMMNGTQTSDGGQEAAAMDAVITAAGGVIEAAKNAAADGGGTGAGGDAQTVGDPGGDTAKSFVGLPIEALICGPIIAAAKGQQQLTALYIDNLMKLAFKDGKSGDTNILTYKYQRPAVKEGQTPEYQDASVQAPLLSLVPVPAFLMDALTVDFEMEVKNSDLQDDKSHTDVSATLKYSSWFGLDASITGAVTSDSEHKRTSDSSATYKISARAIQQPPAEGMAKLTSILTQAMEPIPVGK